MKNISPESGQALPRRLPYPSSRLFGLLLAVLSTGTSLWISVVAGEERGGSSIERGVWAAIGLVLLVAAHLIPAVTRGTAARIRLPALLLWAVCMVITGYGHATFFLAAQRHAGDVRATTVHRSSQLAEIRQPDGCSLAAIARDQAHVRQQLAVARNMRCLNRCEQQTIRRETLAAQLAALDVEAGEARRREEAADHIRSAIERQQAREEQARIDPVTAQAAQLVNASRETIDLMVALVHGAVLECVACLGWLLALHPGRRYAESDLQTLAALNAGVTGPSNVGGTNSLFPQQKLHTTAEQGKATVTPRRSIGAAGNVSPREALSRQIVDSDFFRLSHAIAEGRLRPTVKDIRGFLRCSQDKAMRMRRRLLAVIEGGPSIPPTAAARVRAEQRPRLVHSSPDQPWAA
ncbi:twin-arginine translocation pathway signal protein [Burkholderia multivorans]|uniref:twin-arginine translocation pathway signal protein n=1 Tax=Burkholderia multivorans TaxID=87883 RepID=UPI0021BF3CC1|nr:twin-arginine translocation pathway signal protein [Burkholderia multivorans]